MKKNKQNKKTKNNKNVEISKELAFDQQCNNNKNAAGKNNCKVIDKNK